MVPTLIPGDFVIVDQKHYPGSAPNRGDVVVFKLPTDNSIDYIKRVIGLPGDHIQMKAGILYINNQPCPRKRIGDYLYQEGNGGVIPLAQYIETLPNGVHHRIIKMGDNGPLDNTLVYDVPAGDYFMMGDNRDNSQDSRVLSAVGYVPAENLIGSAELIYWPLNRVSVSVDKGEMGAIPPAPERQSEAAPALPTAPSKAPEDEARPGPQEFAGSDWPMVGIGPPTDQAATSAKLRKIIDAGKESDRRGWNVRLVSSEEERTSATIYADKMLVHLDPTTEKYKTLKAAGMALDYPITFTGRQSNCILSDYAAVNSSRSPKDGVIPVDQIKNYISDAKAVVIIHGVTCARDRGIISEEVAYVELVGEAAKYMRQSADQIAQAGIRMFDPLCHPGRYEGCASSANVSRYYAYPDGTSPDPKAVQWVGMVAQIDRVNKSMSELKKCLNDRDSFKDYKDFGSEIHSQVQCLRENGAPGSYADTCYSLASKLREIPFFTNDIARTAYGNCHNMAVSTVNPRYQKLKAELSSLRAQTLWSQNHD